MRRSMLTLALLTLTAWGPCGPSGADERESTDAPTLAETATEAPTLAPEPTKAATPTPEPTDAATPTTEPRTPRETPTETETETATPRPTPTDAPEPTPSPVPPPADYYVTTSGESIIAGKRAFPSLQAAVDAALNGRSICVLPGRYVGPTTIDGKDLVVFSSGGPAETVMDGEDAGGILFIGDPGPMQALTIDGLTMRNGAGWPAGLCGMADGTAGGAISVRYGDVIWTPTFRRLLIEDSHADTGGGICAAVARLENVAIRNCDGGGVYAGQESNGLTLTGCTIEGNTGGWGVYSRSGVRMLNTIVAWNTDDWGSSSNLKAGGSSSPEYSAFWGGTFPDGSANSGIEGVTLDSWSGSFVADCLVRSDLTLGVTSPCIDYGDPALSDPDGTRSDIGSAGGPLAFDITD